MVRIDLGGGAARRYGARPDPARERGLNVPDELLRPAGEAAVALARQGRDHDPPRPPPRRLQRFLDFAWLPDSALSVVRRLLDDDDDFRASVRDATSEELMGRASWLFLDRPQGWEEELGHLATAAEHAAVATEEAQAEAAATRRLARVEAALRAAEEEAATLRAAVAKAKEELAAERSSRRRVGSEAGRLRRRMAEAEADIHQWRLRTDALEAALARASSDDDVESGPGENRESQRSGGQPAAQPPDPLAPDLDHRALAEAVAAGLAAVNALAEVLTDVGRRLQPSLPASQPPPQEAVPAAKAPAGPVRHPVALPPAVLDDSGEAAEYLVRVDGVLVLVDGYNITKLARPELGLAEQRQWLVDAAVELAARTGARLELVFDGVDKGNVPADLGRRTGVQVRFSPAEVEADDLLLDLVRGLDARPAVVASDDRRVRDGARRLDVNVISAAQLLAVLRRPLP